MGRGWFWVGWDRLGCVVHGILGLNGSLFGRLWCWRVYVSVIAIRHYCHNALLAFSQRYCATVLYAHLRISRVCIDGYLEDLLYFQRTPNTLAVLSSSIVDASNAL